MAWVEMLLKLIVDIVHYAAWPVVVIFALLLFREPINAFLRSLRIRRLSYKNTIVDFLNKEVISQPAEWKKNLFNVTKENLTYEAYLDTIQVMNVLIAGLASRLQEYGGKGGLLEFTEFLVRGYASIVKRERPTSEWVKFMRLGMKLESPEEKQAG